MQVDCSIQGPQSRGVIKNAISSHNSLNVQKARSIILLTLLGKNMDKIVLLERLLLVCLSGPALRDRSIKVEDNAKRPSGLIKRNKR